MTDYTSTFTEADGVDDVDAADFSTEFDAIAVASATKYDSSDLLDEDDMASDDATKFPSQQSVKAYVDSKMTSGTAITCSGNAFEDFTSIPAGTKKVSISVIDIDITAATAPSFYIKLGDSGGIESSGYDYGITNISSSTLSSTAASADTSGFIATAVVSTGTYRGQVNLTLLDSSTNTWTWTATISNNSSASRVIHISSGGKSLTGELTQLRFGMGGTSPILNAGKINTLYEG